MTNEDWGELGRWDQGCAAPAMEALVPPQGQTLWVSHTGVQSSQPVTSPQPQLRTLGWVCMKATTCHVRCHWWVIQLTPLTDKLI